MDNQTHMIIVNGYNVLFSKEEDDIFVSIPGNKCVMSWESTGLDDDFEADLLKRGWSVVALEKLNAYIFGPENRWKGCVNMNVTTGKITSPW